MEFENLSRDVIGVAIEVHKLLGPGLLELAYEECLCYEFDERGIKYERQKPIPVFYKSIKLECGYRADIIVEKKLLVELKSIEALNPIHEAIVLTYLKFSEIKVGLLINFNVTKLKDGIKRYIF